MPGGYWANYPPFQPGRRQPRQLPGRGRRTSMYTKGRAPLAPPPGIVLSKQTQAAHTIQRAFRKKRFVPKKPISVGTEIFQFRLATQSSTVAYQAASESDGPKNSKILMPAGFSQHTTCVDSDNANYTLHGHFLKPVYDYVTKLRVSFKNIAHHSDNQAGLNLRVYHGYIKMSENKITSGSVPSSQAAFESTCLSAIKQELFKSNVTSDPLEFERKNRNVVVLGSFDVRPDRRRMIRMDGITSVTTVTPPGTETGSFKSYNVPPPKVYTIKHMTPKMKTRIEKAADHSFPCLTNLWIPWVMLASPQLTSNSGHFDVEHSSRMYFTDN